MISWIIRSRETLRDLMVQVYAAARDSAENGKDIEVLIRNANSKRTVEQSNKMWAMLGDIARQVPWEVWTETESGQGYLTTELIQPEDWKDILSAASKQELRKARGLNGGVVVLGLKTSKLKIKEMAALIEFMYSFGADKNVNWSEPATAEYMTYPEA